MLLSRIAPRLFRDRDLRVATYGAIGVSASLLMTFVAPMALLAFGPLVFGVPHLVADVRYLVLRHGLHRRASLALLIGGPIVALVFHPHAWVALLAVVGGALAARGRLLPRLGVVVLGLAGVGLAWRSPREADLAIAHLHNVVAVGLVILWSRVGSFRVRRPTRWWVSGPLLGGFVVGLMAIAVGALDGALDRLQQSALLDADILVSTLAPLETAPFAARWVLLFAFAQSVHYAVWVRLVPELDRERPGMRSFSRSLGALRFDLGKPVFFLSLAATLGFAAWGVFALASARDAYLRLAVFHGPLELGAVTLLLLEGRGLSEVKGARPSAGGSWGT